MHRSSTFLLFHLTAHCIAQLNPCGIHCSVHLLAFWWSKTINAATTYLGCFVRCHLSCFMVKLYYKCYSWSNSSISVWLWFCATLKSSVISAYLGQDALDLALIEYLQKCPGAHSVLFILVTPRTATVWWQQGVDCRGSLIVRRGTRSMSEQGSCTTPRIYRFINKVEKSVLNHHSAKRARGEWPPVQVKRCRLCWSSGWATFVWVRYVPSYICMCLRTPSNDSVNHYSPVCSRSLWRRRPLHSLPASCANSPALR